MGSVFSKPPQVVVDLGHAADVAGDHSLRAGAENGSGLALAQLGGNLRLIDVIAPRRPTANLPSGTGTSVRF